MTVTDREDYIAEGTVKALSPEKLIEFAWAIVGRLSDAAGMWIPDDVPGSAVAVRRMAHDATWLYLEGFVPNKKADFIIAQLLHGIAEIMTCDEVELGFNTIDLAASLARGLQHGETQYQKDHIAALEEHP